MFDRENVAMRLSHGFFLIFKECFMMKYPIGELNAQIDRVTVCL